MPVSLVYDHIIVPFDASKGARRCAVAAAELSTLFGSELVLVTASSADNAEDRRQLKGRAHSMSDERVTVWVETASSVPDALETMTAFRPSSLICMHTHARTGLLRTVYGSLAEDLLHRLDVPVMLFGPHWNGASLSTLGHLVVCVDTSPAGGTAVDLACQWLDAMRMNVTLVRVVGKQDVPGSVAELDRRAAAIEPRCDIVEAVDLRRADLVDGVIDIVRHSGNPLVVMTSDFRSGLARVRHGSLVAAMSRDSPVPVLVQRGPA